MPISQESKVGIFAVAGLAVILVGFYFLHGRNLFRKKGMILYGMTKSAENVGTGSKIRINGVDAGTITGMRFSNDYADSVVIEMELKQGLKLAANSAAYLQHSLLGVGFISIVPGDTSDYRKKGLTVSWLKNKDTIPMEKKTWESGKEIQPLQNLLDTVLETIRQIDSLKTKQ